MSRLTDLMDMWLGIYNHFEPETITFEEYINQDNPYYFTNQPIMLTDVKLKKAQLTDHWVKIRDTEHLYVENEVLCEKRYIKQFQESYIEIVYPLVGEPAINTKPGIYESGKYDLVKTISYDRFLQEYYRFFHEIKLAI